MLRSIGIITVGYFALRFFAESWVVNKASESDDQEVKIHLEEYRMAQRDLVYEKNQKRVALLEISQKL